MDTTRGAGGTEVDSVGAKFARRLIDHNRDVIAGKNTSDLLDKFMDAVDELKSQVSDLI